MNIGVAYYTDNMPDPEVMQAVQRCLLNAVPSFSEAVAVSLKPVPNFFHNIVYDQPRSIESMFTQILMGIEAMRYADYIFLVEHDVLYTTEHFQFVPERDDIFYYNTNSWKVRSTDGQALYYWCKQTAFCCGSRRIMLEHYRERVRRVKAEGFRRYNGFEPGTHPIPRGYCNYGSGEWRTTIPNIDIRHASNLTWSRWDKKHFRNPVRDWEMADEVPGWGRTKDRFSEWLKENSHATQTSNPGA